MKHFEVVGAIEGIETLAVSSSIRNIERLREQ